MKEAPAHKDVLGKDINIGDFVVVSYNRGLRVCKVSKFTPKMMRVHPVDTKRKHSGYLKYGQETAIVSGEDVFVYVLGNLDKSGA
jgi:hypothetical protein